MSVCHAASIVVDDKSVAFFGPEDAHWRVPLERIRALGEVRSSSLEDGHYLALLIDDSGAWLQAPVRAAGMDRSIERLAAFFGQSMSLELARAATNASRVLWPATLAGEALFEWDERERMVVRAHVLSAIGKA